MIKNPVVNAIAAEVYIVAVALFMFYGPQASGIADREDTIVIPIAMISLLTFSAAVMGYLFLSQPLQLYFDGKKKEAVSFFLKTLGTFGIITALAFVTLFSGIIG